MHDFPASELPTAFRASSAGLIIGRQFRESEVILRKLLGWSEDPIQHHTGSESLILKVLRLDTPKLVSVSLGQLFPHSPVRFHLDNFVAGLALSGALHNVLGYSQEHVTSDDELLDADLRGDIVCIGGANSTLLTALAFEYVGKFFEYLRPEDRGLPPIIPLAYYGIGHREIAQRRSYIRDETAENDIDLLGYNWPIRGVVSPYAHPKYEGLHWPMADPCNARLVNGEWYPCVTSDYLVVTRIPNFLSPDFNEYQPTDWSYILVIAGCHGCGTRAIELLLRQDSAPLLETLVEALRNDSVFQILLEADVRADANARHTPHAIRILDVIGLRHEPERYARARNLVSTTIANMPELEREQNIGMRRAVPIPAIYITPKSHTSDPRSQPANLDESQVANISKLGDADVDRVADCSFANPESRRSQASSGRNGGPPGAAEPMTNFPQHPQWQRLSAYRDQWAVQFDTRDEVYRAIELFCRDEQLYGAPYVPAGRNTLIVAAEVIPYLKARGLNFTESKVFSASELPLSELRRMQQERRSRSRPSP